MKRRRFLQSFAALAASPFIPSMGAGALAVGKTSAATPAVSAHAYQWAEVIVRAHKTSSLAMLQRHLRIDVAAAKAVQSQLIRNGVIGAQANAYGIYKATNPLFDGLIQSPTKVVETGKDLLKNVAKDKISDANEKIEKIDVVEVTADNDLNEEEILSEELPITLQDAESSDLELPQQQ